MSDPVRVILEIRPARTSPIQFLVRRTAHPKLDHVWELEDRDLPS